MLADRLADDAIEVRTDAIGAALLGGVAGLALGKNGFALGNVTSSEEIRQRQLSRPATLGTFFDDALDRVAHLFRTVLLVGQEVVRRQAGEPQSHDAPEQGPSGDGIETIVHLRAP